MTSGIMKNIKRLAAFSQGDKGGNPAGVLIAEKMPTEKDMLKIAAAVNYSETAFVTPSSDDQQEWRVRYFSPKVEIPFCGHATIALTAVLGQETGQSDFTLTLNDAVIEVNAGLVDGHPTASIKSPPTWSKPLDAELQDRFCGLFGFNQADLSTQLPPAMIHGGATHILLPLKDRKRLSQMMYDFDQGADLMTQHGITTVMLVYPESKNLFHVRNAFAVGGVIEDPATGAAAAALGGYLRDLDWTCDQQFTIKQGEDMGVPSIINVRYEAEQGSPVTVSGTVRPIQT